MADKDNFADKVIAELKKSSRAVDLTNPTQEEEVVTTLSNDFIAYAGQQLPGAGEGPTTGGNKDINIVPGFGGAAATSVSEINFLWVAPGTPDTTGLGNNIKTTIYNYATTATNPVLVIGGYDGTTRYVPTRSYGSNTTIGTGVTAKIWIDPFLGYVAADYHTFNTAGAAVAATSTAGWMYYDATQNRYRGGTIPYGTAGIAKTFAFTDDIPSTSGLATTASNISSVTATTSADHFVLFSPQNGLVGGIAVSSDTTFKYNPATDVLTVTSVSGTATTGKNLDVTTTTSSSTHYLMFTLADVSVSGAATSTVSTIRATPSSGTLSATTFSGAFSGNLTGNVTGTATTGKNVDVLITSANSSHPIMFTPATTSVSGAATSTVSTVSVNPSSGTISATTFSGAFSGNVTGNLTGNVTGTATTGKNVDVLATTANASHPIMFTPATTSVSGAATSTVSTVSINPSSGTITATTFSGSFNGNAGTATTAANINVATTNTASTVYPVFSGAATTTTGTGVSSSSTLSFVPSTGVLSATTFSGAFSGNLTGTATTGKNIDVLITSANSSHPIIFTPATTSVSGAATSTVSTVSVNPSSGTISATTFSGAFSGNVTGNLTGNVTGTATTGKNVDVLITSANSSHPIMFTPATTSVSGAATSTVSTVSVNPSSGTISATTFSGAFSGNVTGNLTGNVTGTATTGKNVDVTLASTNASHPIMFTPATTTVSGAATSTVSTVTINPSNSSITATTFSGTATTSTNVNVTTTSSNIAYYMAYTPASTTVTGGALNSGVLTFNPSTGTIATATGNLTLAPNGATVNVSNNLVVQGNLTVNGTTVTVNSTTTTLQDPIMVVGSGTGGTHPAADDNKDRGIEFRYVDGAGSAATGFFGFQDSSNKFVFYRAGTNTNEVFAGSLGTISAATIEGVHFGNVIGNVTGTATTGKNVDVLTTSNNSSHYVMFTPATTSVSGAATSTNSSLSYNPSTGTLSATFYNGTFSGTVAGYASTANNANVVAAGASSFSHSVVFTTATTAAGAALSTDSTLTYNPSTDTLSATTFSGAFSGNVTGNLTGNVTGTATTGKNVDVLITSANASHPIMFTPATTSVSGAATSTVSTVSVNPSSGTITATTFSGAFSGNVTGNLTGNVTGTATTGKNVDILTTTSSSTHYLMFTPASTNVSGAATSTVSTISATPSSGTLTATTFSGAFSGNVTGTATTGKNVDVLITSANSSHPIMFTPATTSVSGAATSTVSTVSVNPSSGTISATTFSGAFSGNVTGNLTGNVTGTATTGKNVDVLVASTNANHPIMFTPATTSVSGAATSTVSTVSINPSSGTITATTFSGSFNGNAGTATTAANINVATTNTASTVYPVFSGAATTTTGTGVSSSSTLSFVPSTGVLSATTFSGAHTGNLTGNVTGTATTGKNVDVTLASTNASHPIMFTPATTTVSGAATSTVSTVSVNPSNGTITATTFSGSLTGNAGSATTGLNVNVTAATTTGTHYLVFTPAAGTVAGAAISSAAGVGLTVNPNTGLLTSGPQLVTSTSALTSGTYLTIQTNVSDDSTTSDFFIRGLTSTAGGSVSKFSVDANGNLRATTKSFDIEHPTKPGMRLVYGVLEGPEHGVYHRGTIEGSGILRVELPEYWYKLIGDQYSVQLSTWGNYGVHIVEKTENYFTIQVNGFFILNKYKNIKVDYIIHGSRLDAPLEIEQK